MGNPAGTTVNLENRLWASALHLAAENGMEFTVPCSQNLRDLIRAGISTMRRENRLDESDGELADAALSTLVQEMVRVTRDLNLSTLVGQKIPIREGALVLAKKLCPLWPYG